MACSSAGSERPARPQTLPDGGQPHAQTPPRVREGEREGIQMGIGRDQLIPGRRWSKRMMMRGTTEDCTNDPQPSHLGASSTSWALAQRTFQALRRYFSWSSHTTQLVATLPPLPYPPPTGAPVHVHGHGMPGRGQHQDPGGQAHGRVGMREAGKSIAFGQHFT